MLKYLFCVMLIAGTCSASAQIPRNAAGLYEYNQLITVDNTPATVLKGRATQFFSRPLLVHWDSLYAQQADNPQAPAGGGYIEIGVNRGVFGKKIKVALMYFIAPQNNAYEYSIRQLAVRGEDGTLYPLEDQPSVLKYKQYDQLLNRTHDYLQRVIGYMKREMNGMQ